MPRPRVVTVDLASIDGRLTLAPGYSLMAPDERWNEVIKGLGDPYLWARDTREPGMLLEGSGSFVSPAYAELIALEAGPLAEGAHFLPDDVIGVRGRRWFVVVGGRGAVDLRFTEWPDPSWAGWHSLVFTSQAVPDGHLERLRERGIPYISVGREHVDLPRALELAYELLGITVVLCTGVARLSGIEHGCSRRCRHW